MGQSTPRSCCFTTHWIRFKHYSNHSCYRSIKRSWSHFYIWPKFLKISSCSRYSLQFHSKGHHAMYFWGNRLWCNQGMLNIWSHKRAMVWVLVRWCQAINFTSVCWQLGLEMQRRILSIVNEDAQRWIQLLPRPLPSEGFYHWSPMLWKNLLCSETQHLIWHSSFDNKRYRYDGKLSDEWIRSNT